MNISIVVSTFPAISETFVLDQLVGLLDAGHKVSIFACSPARQELKHELVNQYDLLVKTNYWGPLSRNPLVRIVGGARRLIRKNNFSRVVRLLKTLDFFRYGWDALSLRLLFAGAAISANERCADVLVCHHGLNGRTMAILKEIGFVKGEIVTAFHGADLSSYVRRRGLTVYDHLFETGSLYLPISRRLMDVLQKLGAPKEKIIVHHMGIDCGKFAYCQKRIKEGDTKRFISVARLVEKKGITYAVRAFSEAIKRYPNMEYLIVGDGPLSAEITQVIKNEGISSNVKMLGWKTRAEVIALLQQSDALLAPSVTARDGDEEGIPVSIMEGMALGVPVISTFHSAIPELIQDGVAGFLVPERNIEALSLAICKAIESEDALLGIKQRARQTIEEQFDTRILNKTFCEIIEGLSNLH